MVAAAVALPEEAESPLDTDPPAAQPMEGPALAGGGDPSVAPAAGGSQEEALAVGGSPQEALEVGSVALTAGAIPAVAQLAGVTPRVAPGANVFPQVALDAGGSPQVALSVGSVALSAGAIPAVAQPAGMYPQVAPGATALPQIAQTAGVIPPVARSAGEDPQVAPVRYGLLQAAQDAGLSPQNARLAGVAARIEHSVGQCGVAQELAQHVEEVAPASAHDALVVRLTQEAAATGLGAEQAARLCDKAAASSESPALDARPTKVVAAVCAGSAQVARHLSEVAQTIKRTRSVAQPIEGVAQRYHEMLDEEEKDFTPDYEQLEDDVLLESSDDLIEMSDVEAAAESETEKSTALAPATGTDTEEAALPGAFLTATPTLLDQILFDPLYGYNRTGMGLPAPGDVSGLGSEGLLQPPAGPSCQPNVATRVTVKQECFSEPGSDSGGEDLHGGSDDPIDCDLSGDNPFFKMDFAETVSMAASARERLQSVLPVLGATTDVQLAEELVG